MADVRNDDLELIATGPAGRALHRAAVDVARLARARHLADGPCTVAVLVRGDDSARVAVIPAADLAAVAATIADSRRTHVEWRDWFAVHPDDERAAVLGDTSFHASCVVDYDRVLDALKALGA